MEGVWSVALKRARYCLQRRYMLKNVWLYSGAAVRQHWAVAGRALEYHPPLHLGIISTGIEHLTYQLPALTRCVSSAEIEQPVAVEAVPSKLREKHFGSGAACIRTASYTDAQRNSHGVGVRLRCALGHSRALCTVQRLVGSDQKRGNQEGEPYKGNQT